MSLKNKIDMETANRQTFYKWLLLGESKTGKTTAFRTFPGKKLAIALTPRTRSALVGCPQLELVEHFEQESNIKRLRGSQEYSIVPKAWDELWTTIVELWELAHTQDTKFPYESILLDDLSTANVIAMNHVLSLKKKDGTSVPKGLGGAPAQAHYMPQMSLMSRLINGLFLTLPCHILVCGHMTFKENPDTGISAYYPSVYGNLRENIASWFDEVYETRRDFKQGKTSYIWKTAGYGQKQFLGSTIGVKNNLEIKLGQVAGVEQILQTYRKEVVEKR